MKDARMNSLMRLDASAQLRPQGVQGASGWPVRSPGRCDTG